MKNLIPPIIKIIKQIEPLIIHLKLYSSIDEINLNWNNSKQIEGEK
jgi:hypothetical protein